MQFSQLSSDKQLEAVKKEFANLIKDIFEKPDTLISFVKENKLPKNQVRGILKRINTLNAEECTCCRRYDPALLKMPISQELEPLIDIAQSIANSKQY